YKYSLNLLGTEGLNDLVEHTVHAQNIYRNSVWDSWLQRPYLFWHLCVKGCIKFLAMPVKEASAFTCATFSAFNYFVSFYLLDCTASRLAGCDAGMVSSCAAGMLGLVQPMYVYWFNVYQYEGQFSINPLFNPTHMAVKPLGLLCFMLAVDLIRCYKGMGKFYFPGACSTKWLYALFGAILLLSAFAKPTFMYMLLPAGAVYLLVELALIMVHKGKGYGELWRFVWRMTVACIPALVYLAFEYIAFYFWGGTNSDAHVAIYPFLTAWHIYSPNVPKSLILSMSFPFWMVLANWKYFLHSVEGKLSVIGYIVGTLEFSFFVETGFKLSHLNFAWPMLSGMLLLWVTSAACLIRWTVSDKTGRWNRVVVIVGWLLLSIHLFSGLYYINPYMYII
ncbi:MAG: hypothetical protein K2L18_03035, partial [Acetatifactor sp.]|nr:hypothetical protein [Acetatifactor sp.]